MTTQTKYQSFEDYLKWAFGADYSDGVLDDDMPDAFDRWLENLDGEQYIRFADDYAYEIRTELGK